MAFILFLKSMCNIANISLSYRILESTKRKGLFNKFQIFLRISYNNK